MRGLRALRDRVCVRVRGRIAGGEGCDSGETATATVPWPRRAHRVLPESLRKRFAVVCPRRDFPPSARGFSGFRREWRIDLETAGHPDPSDARFLEGVLERGGVPTRALCQR